jgi:hypothetical protein
MAEKSGFESVGVFPMSTQNFITARCSTFSANVLFFSYSSGTKGLRTEVTV